MKFYYDEKGNIISTKVDNKWNDFIISAVTGELLLRISPNKDKIKHFVSYSMSIRLYFDDINYSKVSYNDYGEVNLEDLNKIALGERFLWNQKYYDAKANIIYFG